MTRTLTAALALLLTIPVAFAGVATGIFGGQGGFFQGDGFLTVNDTHVCTPYGGSTPIDKVLICWRKKHTRAASIENLDPEPTTVAAQFGTGVFALEAMGETVYSEVLSAENRIFPLPGFDGSLDFGGPSGTQFVDSTDTLGLTVISAKEFPKILMFVNTGGALDLRVFSQDTTFASGGGNLQAGLSSELVYEMEVIYDPVLIASLGL